MNIIKSIIAAVLFVSYLKCSAQSKEISFTLEDRDRIIQTQIEMNVRFESQQKQIDFKFDSPQQQINDIKTLFYRGFGIMISFMLFIFGYIIWNRKTVTEPLRENIHNRSYKHYANTQKNSPNWRTYSALMGYYDQCLI